MKNTVLAFLLMLSAKGFAQIYPDYNSNYGNGNYNNQYDNYNNDDYYPDDYYYQYPRDYFTDDFYRDSYNDYRKSITRVNWNKFFRQYRLLPWQINQIIYLNQMYSSYAAWDSYYRYNPDRWYYDRFYALQNILGPQVYIIFQNNYYNGYNPIVYYQDYRMRYYSPTVYVRPMYRNVNINIYRMNPRAYHKDYGYYYSQKNGFNFKDAPNGFRNQNPGFRSSGMRNQNSDNGFRNDDAINGSRTQSNQNGFRNPANQNGSRNESSNSGFRTPQAQENVVRDRNSGSNNGFRGNSDRENQVRSNSISQEKSSNGSGFRASEGNNGFRR